MNLVNRLLRKNLSTAQLIGFSLSNFIGIAIVITGIQFFCDVRSIWEDEDSFIKKDYLVINKKVTSANTLGQEGSGFSAADMESLRNEPWVRHIGSFKAADFRVYARMNQAGRSMSTFLFLESIPSEFIDVAQSEWQYTPGAPEVPIIMSKDYLTLYNFGFATSAGMPKMSESLMSSVPLQLSLSSEDDSRHLTLNGRIVGFSNRLNTILVPQAFMEWANANYGQGRELNPQRLIIDVSKPGDVAITKYLNEHDYEAAGENRSSQASYLLNVITGIVLGVGAVITILSLFILMLSISLLMQKNREKLHALIMLGFPLARVGAPYRKLIALTCVVALALALAAMYIFRIFYYPSIQPLTDGGIPNMWLSPLVGVALTAIIIGANILAVNRKVRGAFR